MFTGPTQFFPAVASGHMVFCLDGISRVGFTSIKSNINQTKIFKSEQLTFKGGLLLKI